MIFPKEYEESFAGRELSLRLPIYLDAKLQRKLERLAQKNGKRC
jgi:hypothetical protein